METKFISIESGECSQNETIFFETKEDQEIFIEDDTMVGNGLFARELLKIARNNLKALTEEKEIIIHDLGSTNIYRDKMKHLKIYAVVRTKEDWLKFCLDYDAGYVREVATYLNLEMPCFDCRNLTEPSGIMCRDRGHMDTGLCSNCLEEDDNKSLQDTWKNWMCLEDKVKAIQDAQYNGMEDYSIFSARNFECPVLAHEIGYFQESY